MVPAHDIDPATAYEDERVSFVELLQSLPAAALRTTVVATPEWSVQDVLAHVVGITADLNAQRFGAGSSDDWTAAQVSSRACSSLAELAAEWDGEAPQFEDGLRLFGYSVGAHFLSDLLQHVSDVRTALGLPATRDDLHLAAALDFYLESFEETLDDRGAGSVDVRTDGESWHLGPGPCIATLAGTRFELFRALGGRRTLDELRGLVSPPGDGDGDAAAVIGSISRYAVPAASIGDR